MTEWEELERAMGFGQGGTCIAGLTEADRCELLGRSMDWRGWDAGRSQPSIGTAPHPNIFIQGGHRTGGLEEYAAMHYASETGESYFNPPGLKLLERTWMEGGGRGGLRGWSHCHQFQHYH